MEEEKPQVYIVARSWSCDIEQLAYIETRLCCLQHLQRNLSTTHGKEIEDITRFFHDNLKEVSRKESSTTALAVEHMQKGHINWMTVSLVDMSLLKTDKTYNPGQNLRGTWPLLT